jgi:hypothetical protein
MFKLQTPVEIGKSRFGISFDDQIIILGSCFADNIGKKLSEVDFNVCVNPFGTLYNPQSISNSVERLSSHRNFTEADCIPMGADAGLICSFSHHTSFARATEKDFLDNANQSLDKASSFFHSCNKMLITLGTAWCYRLNSSGLIVSNCLKRDAKEFTREMMHLEDVIDNIERMVSSCGKEKKFIFTLSPIRHLSDGAHNNQLSKSTLLLAIEEICKRHPDQCEYFPAYELMMDELRDYRFYAEDMFHPSEQAVNYIWERFCDFALNEQDAQKATDNLKAFKRLSHRPITKQ